MPTLIRSTRRPDWLPEGAMDEALADARERWPNETRAFQQAWAAYEACKRYMPRLTHRRDCSAWSSRDFPDGPCDCGAQG